MHGFTSCAARAVPVALVLLAGCRTTVPAPVPEPASSAARLASAFRTGHDVIAAMHDRYAGKWFRSMTFTQKTSRQLANGTWRTDTWYEALKLPGRLRIDFDPITGGSGVLFVRDSQFAVQNGKVVRAGPGINDLLLLGFDVYGNAPAHTESHLRRQGYDLARVHADTFAGRPMLVVGAEAGDVRSRQFWIDAERLYFVRLIEPWPRDTTKRQDVRFLNYYRAGEAWISPRVELYADGKLVFYEDYSDIHTNVALEDALFDAAKWKTAKHWMQ